MLPGQRWQNKHFLFLQPHPFTRVQQLPAFAPALESSILFLFLVSQVLSYKIMPLMWNKKRPFTAPWWATTLFLMRTLYSFLPKPLTSTQWELTFKGSFSEASPALSLVLYLRSLSRWSMVEYPSEEKTQQSGVRHKREQKQSWCKQNSSAEEKENEPPQAKGSLLLTCSSSKISFLPAKNKQKSLLFIALPDAGTH